MFDLVLRCSALLFLVFPFVPVHPFTLEISGRPFAHSPLTSTAISIDSAQEGVLPSPPNLVVILPAYNEVLRIDDTLKKYQNYLCSSSTWRDKSRILVVDDGSDDGTPAFVQTLVSSSKKIPLECISLPDNQGKGAAISFGIQHVAAEAESCNALVLIADADGSADMSSLTKMVQALHEILSSTRETHQDASSAFWDAPALIVGDRGYEGTTLSRSILRWGFRTVVFLFCGDLRVSDSQCGFKLLTLAAAEPLYRDLYLTRWANDVEVLCRAREWNLPIAQVPVQWQDKEGSKLVTSLQGVIQASINMLLAVLMMRIKYALGQWQLPTLEQDTKLKDKR